MDGNHQEWAEAGVAQQRPSAAQGGSRRPCGGVMFSSVGHSTMPVSHGGCKDWPSLGRTAKPWPPPLQSASEDTWEQNWGGNRLIGDAVRMLLQQHLPNEKAMAMRLVLPQRGPLGGEDDHRVNAGGSVPGGPSGEDKEAPVEDEPWVREWKAVRQTTPNVADEAHDSGSGPRGMTPQQAAFLRTDVMNFGKMAAP